MKIRWVIRMFSGWATRVAAQGTADEYLEWSQIAADSLLFNDEASAQAQLLIDFQLPTIMGANPRVLPRRVP